MYDTYSMTASQNHERFSCLMFMFDKLNVMFNCSLHVTQRDVLEGDKCFNSALEYERSLVTN